MKLSDLKVAEGSREARMRKGRGRASKGKTAGRGENGQTKKDHTRPGFEGGQMPMYRQMPKRGFNNRNRKEYEVVNLDKLSKFRAGSTVTPDALVKKGIVKNTKDGIKILGNGKIAKKLTVKANKFSKSAKSAIENAGGKTEVI